MLAELEEGRRGKAEEQARRREEARARRVGAPVEVEEEDSDAMIDYGSSADEGGDVDGGMDDEGDEAMRDADGGAANPMAALLASARSRAHDFDGEGSAGSDADEPLSDEDNEDPDTAFDHTPANQRQHTDTATPATHARATDEIFNSADTLLHVLDARDPLATLSKALLARARADPAKRLLLVLNKADLVPADTLASWLAHLRAHAPVLPLVAAKSAPGARVLNASLTRAGTASALLRALRAQGAARGLRRALCVGVLGVPNVGKSSAVNALASRLGAGSHGAKSRDVCPAGAEAGVTRALRSVKVDGALRVLDGPGVLPAVSGTSSAASKATSRSMAKASKPRNAADDPERDIPARLTLLATYPPAQTPDPEAAVALLLHRAARSGTLDALLQSYGVPALANGPDMPREFLVHVARARGRLGRGGVANVLAAGMGVLGDWRDGRVAAWAEPPSAGPGGAGVGGAGREDGAKAGDEKKIVREWAAEFKIEGLWNDVDGKGAVSAQVAGGGDGDDVMVE